MPYGELPAIVAPKGAGILLWQEGAGRFSRAALFPAVISY
jgi:hypothetical protein